MIIFIDLEWEWQHYYEFKKKEKSTTLRTIRIRLTVMDTRNNKTKIYLYQLTLNAKLSDFSLVSPQNLRLKFIFSKKATKIDKIFTVDLTFTTIASNRK